MSKILMVILSTLLTIVVVAILFFSATSTGREMWNNYIHGLKKADEVSYETRKTVEDTARSYISSYNSDVAIYRMYAASADPEKREYAESARMRAIRTATAYNEYILKNSYVWKDNVPLDIYKTLDVDIGNMETGK